MTWRVPNGRLDPTRTGREVGRLVRGPGQRSLGVGEVVDDDEAVVGSPGSGDLVDARAASRQSRRLGRAERAPGESWRIEALVAEGATSSAAVCEPTRRRSASTGSGAAGGR